MNATKIAVAVAALLVAVALGMAVSNLLHARHDIEQQRTVASSSSSPHVPDNSLPLVAAPNPPAPTLKQPRERELPPGETRFAFQPITEQTFVLNPGEGRYVSVGAGKLTDRIVHVHMASASPVDMGILATFVVQQPNVNLTNLGNVSLCHQPRVTGVDFDCVIPGNRQTEGLDLSFVIRDARSGAGIVASLGAAMLGSKTALNNESVRNDVELVISKRQCVAFCSPKDE